MIIDHIKHISFYEPMAAGITEAWNAIQAMLHEKGEFRLVLTQKLLTLH